MQALPCPSVLTRGTTEGGWSVMDARSLPWTTPAPNEAATNVWEAARAEQRCAELKRDPLSVVDDVLRLRATWGVTAGSPRGPKGRPSSRGGSTYTWKYTQKFFRNDNQTRSKLVQSKVARADHRYQWCRSPLWVHLQPRDGLLQPRWRRRAGNTLKSM